MNEEFSYDRYVELIRKRKNEYDDSAKRYVEKFIPSTLYKYMYVESEEESLDKRKQRFDTLKEEKIWASRVNNLNDPFEVKLFKYDLKNELVLEFNENVIKEIEIISLSGTPLDKLMWSHYSKGHTGICLEYEVVGFCSNILPVEYYEIYDRYDVTEKIVNWMNEKNLVLDGKLSSFDVSGDVAEIARIYFRKDKVWDYENEYRIVTKTEIVDDCEQKGSRHSLSDVGLKLKSIILGLNCCKKDEQDIKKIVDAINENRLEEMLSGDKLYNYERMKKVMMELGDFVQVKKIYINETELTLEIKEYE